MSRIRKWAWIALSAGVVVGGLGGGWALAAGETPSAMHHKHGSAMHHGAGMHAQGSAMHDAASSSAELTG